ncbi:MAG TPA: [LysW]-aminoadipate kinase [Herpetosiphonaceae bacterium]|nr:[LysW]-aminoadipate kinase [Herpetosiphonaceae bacterium]
MNESPMVVKIGGAAGIEMEALCLEIAARWHAGERMVLIHGGSDATNVLAEQLGHPPRMVVSPSGHHSRYTDRRTLEIFAMATAGINRALVERLQALGVPAWGLSGVDGRVLRARRKSAIRVVEEGRVRVLRDDWTGTVEAADGDLLRALLDERLGRAYLPVLAPLAAGENGEMLNVDGDRTAAVVAAALAARTLVLLSNVAGLLRRYPDERSLVSELAAADIDTAMEWCQGRMKKKLLGAREALTRGIDRVIIGDARRARPLGDALAGHGTTIGQVPALSP